MTKSLLTRVVHGLLALAVLHQLAVSLFMEAPRHGREAEGLPGTLFVWHEDVGLFAFVVVAVFWMWILMRRGETPLGKLLPWFSRVRMKELKDDGSRHVRALRRMDLPRYRDQSALAAATHGLGLLTITAMGVTGGIFYFGHDAPGALGQIAAATKDVHETLATLVWAYFYGHVGISLLHALKGDDVVRPMFRLQSRRVDDADGVRGGTSKSAT